MSYQPPTPPSLVMRRGPRPNQVFSLHKAVLTIGRATDNDIVVDNAGVSRHHARLTRRGDDWVLEDLGSRNGTFVNGQRITGPVILGPGSQMGLGPDVLFGMEAAVAAPPPSPPEHVLPAKKAKVRAWWFVPLILLGILAFAALLLSLVWFGGRARHTPGSGPAVRITNLHNGDRVPTERAVILQSEAKDTTNLITQIELWVDGQLQWVDGSQEPEGTSHFVATQSWQPASPGPHTVMVRALNGKGAASEEIIVVEAVEDLVAVGPRGEEVYLDDLTSVTYVSFKGETLGDISQKHGVSERDIVAMNPSLEPGQPLEGGQVVVVPFDLNWAEREEGEEQEVGPPEPSVVIPDPPDQFAPQGEPADLIITNLTLSNLNPLPGEEIVVGVTIMNAGGTPAEGLHWAWDPGTGEGWIHDERPIDYLSPGDDIVREMAYSYEAEGRYRGYALADARSAYDEADEGDNLAYATVTVAQERQIAAHLAYYDYQDNAWAIFSVENAGNVTFESMHAIVNCGAGRFEVQDDQPFLSRPSNRPPQGPVLHPGGLAYLAIEIGPMSAGTMCEAALIFYSEDSAAGLATEGIVVPFTIQGERPVEPVQPIPQNPLGDLIRLSRRIRLARANRSKAEDEASAPQVYWPGSEDPPLAPVIEDVHHDGCEIVITWCPGSSNELAFYLYRWDTTTGGDFEEIAEFVNPPRDRCHEYRDPVPHAGEYYYKVQASNESGEGVSDIVREQVTADDCPALAHLAESNLMVLEVEALDMVAWGEYDKVYCYAALDDLPEERFPPNDGEFFELEEGTLTHWNIEQYLAGENSRILTVPADQPLKVWVQCYAWTGDQHAELGEFWGNHPPEEWDGRDLYGEGGGFQVHYHINPVTGAGMISQDFPDPSCGSRLPAPYDLGGGWHGSQPTLEWSWDVDVNRIQGFWILCNGEKIEWVSSLEVGREGPNRYSSEINEFLAFPDCGGCDLSVVAGCKDEPCASNVCYNSPASDPLSRHGPPCEATVTVRFDTIEFPWLEDDSAAVYGYLIVNDQHLGLAIPYYDDANMFWAEEGRTYTLAHLGDLIARNEMIFTDWGVISQYRMSGPEITLNLDWTTPLEVIVDIREFAIGNNDTICFSHMSYSPGFTGVYLGEASHQTSGIGQRGSCVVNYTLLITSD